MYVHGNNLSQKENHKTKYQDIESQQFLAEIRIKYNKWKRINEKLQKPLAIPTNKDADISELPPNVCTILMP